MTMTSANYGIPYERDLVLPNGITYLINTKFNQRKGPYTFDWKNSKIINMGPAMDAGAPTNLNIYVSTTGNDENSGLSPLYPVRTIEQAISISKDGWGDQATINFGAGTFTLEAGANFYLAYPDAGQKGGPLVIQGAPPVDAGFGVRTIAGVSAAPTTSHLVITDSAGGFVNNELIGLTVYITSGAAITSRGIICHNTANQITVLTDIAGLVNGDTFEIQQNATIFHANASIVLNGTQSMTVFSNIDFHVNQNESYILVGLLIIAPNVRFINISGAGVAQIIFAGTRVVAGQNGAFIPNTMIQNCGMAFDGNGGLIQMISVTAGELEPSNTLYKDCFFFVSGSNLSFPVCHLEACQTIFQNSLLAMERTEIEDSPADGLTLVNASATITNSDIRNSAGDGIHCTMSRVMLQNVTSGIQNGGYGVHMSNRSDLTGDTSSGVISIAGALGEVKIGVNAPVTWAAINGAGTAALRTDSADPDSEFCFVSFV